MDAIRLGAELAHLASWPYFKGFNHQANGGWDQWVVALMRRARRDYLILRDAPGQFNTEAALTRYRKMLAFVMANRARMVAAKPGNFTGDVEQLVSNIIEALESANDTRFDPFCVGCGKDTLLDQLFDPLNNSCECWIDRSYDLGVVDDETYYRLGIIY